MALRHSGTSRAVMEFALPYTKERVVHGDALAKKQTIAFRLADMRIETDAMRWMTWKAASILEKVGDATRQAQLGIHLCRRAGDVDSR
jgi:alkylation response protein AidB-like acyl-CoA dehydrogenase